MHLQLEKTERLLLGALLALLLVAVSGPAVTQSAHHHDFADQRVWGGIPCALDVLSNLPFALWGLVGLGCLALQSGFASPPVANVQRRLAALFFGGLIITTGASAWYHWQPDDTGLAVDRLGMVFAFAGLMGLAAADRVSQRAGMALGGAVMLLGPLSIWAWVVSANVLPWAVVQFGGMAMVLYFACLKPLPGALAVRWGLVLAIYAAAKLLEMADAWVYMSSAGIISGHSLKHVVASCAAWPVLAAIMQTSKIRAESGSPSRAGWATAGSRKSLPQNN